jgi:hypothetical protein
MKETMKKKAVMIFACGAIYFGAYCVLLHPILAGPPGHLVRFESYTNPFTMAEAHDATPFRHLFWPAHQVDVMVRHGFWFPA